MKKFTFTTSTIQITKRLLAKHNSEMSIELMRNIRIYNCNKLKSNCDCPLDREASAVCSGFVTNTDCPALFPHQPSARPTLNATITSHSVPSLLDYYAANRSMTLVCNLGAKGRLPRSALILESVRSDFPPRLVFLRSTDTVGH